MSTNTYRLAVTLQAKAIDSIDLHTRGAYTVAHTVGDDITVIGATAPEPANASCRCGHMTPTRTCSVRLKPTDPSAAASSPATSPHSAASTYAGNAASSPPPRSTATPPSSPSVLIPARPRSDSMPAAAPITTSLTTGRTGRSPHDTTWSLLVGTTRRGLLVARTKVDVDTAISYAAELETRHLVAV